MAILAVGCAEDPADPPYVDPNDLDGDGIANADDLCPNAKDPLQHDEDRDGVGDACDVCPATFDPGQGDIGELDALQFADGVGDACDPRPARGGEKLAGFHAFAAGSNIASFTNAGWTAGDDVISTTTPARWTVPRAVTGDGLFVQARLALVWQAGTGSVSVGVDGTAAGLAYTCSVVKDSDGDGFDEMTLVEETGQSLTKSLGVPVTGPLVLTAWRVIDRDRIGQIYCFVDHMGVHHELSITTSDFSTGFYGFSATGADTTIASVVAYVSPLIPCMFRSSCEDAPPLSERDSTP
ncbi:MAG TPA: hypothetical protein VFQ53_34110 [Kofleriaceae bacterium]|nr:hypothetical protein [Kofleriaceae bacterium]